MLAPARPGAATGSRAEPVNDSCRGWLPCGAAVDLWGPPGPPGAGVVLVPPFGFEGVAAHRPLLEWGRRLAAQGHPVVRLDLPGSGDSAGTAADADLDGWRRSVVEAARLLREGGAPAVTVLGLGMGGYPALAAADDHSVDDVVCWTTSAKGSRELRRLRAYSLLNGGPPEALPDGGISHYGFVLSARLGEQLERYDAATSAPEGHIRALVLGGDNPNADAQLVDALAARGWQVDSATATGYAAMTMSPQTAVTAGSPVDLLHDRLTGPRPGDHWQQPELARTLDLGGAVERPVTVTTSAGVVRGIRTTPAAGGRERLVLLNAGATRHTGPNRLWVTLARTAATDGVEVLRLDAPGVGDSDGALTSPLEDARLYGGELVTALEEALTLLAPDGDVTLAGLCSGACWALQLAPRLPSVREVVALNPRVLVWQSWRGDTDAASDARRLLRLDTWRRALRKGLSVRHGVHVARAVLAKVRHAAGRRLGGGDPDSTEALIAATADRLADAGVRVTVCFSQDEPLARELDRSGERSRLESRGWRFRDLDGPPDRHTMAPMTYQDAVVDLLRRAGGAVAPATPADRQRAATGG